MTNSDQYMTATDQLENIDFSDLILKLTGKSFYLKGYPKSHKEKLILITISRYIEQLSYNHGGRHYATFQNISRLDDEIGTYEIYKSLGECVDDLNLYGIANNDQNLSYIFNNIDGHFNIGKSEAHKRLWVVIHISDENHMALAAVEDKNNSNEWNATWTDNREKVLKLEKSMNEYF